MTSPAAPIRVLVAEDNYLTRLGTVTLLRTQPDMEVVGEAEDGTAALDLYRRTAADVVVADLKMPGLDGVALAAALARETPPGKMLVLTHYDGDENVFRALKAGARGYLTKGVRPGDFLGAVRAVYAGDRYLPPDIAGKVAERMMQPGLSPRELQVLELVYRGMSNRQIAATLSVSERTVGMFVSNILAKLDARSRTEAVSIAIERGILQPR